MTVAKLQFIICGLEHSGTTLASELFRQHPNCDSGFECGVLLRESPREFPKLSPFYENMIGGWGLQPSELAAACNENSFEGFYQAVIANSSILKPKNARVIFDKTPRYITRIEWILSSTTLPIIAMIKDPRAIALSDFNRSEASAETIDAWYEGWMPKKIKYMRAAYKGYLNAWSNDRCIVVRLEEMCLNTRPTLEKMFAHVGIEPSLSFLNLANKRYGNTKGTTIDATSCFLFSKLLPARIQNRITEDFSEFNQWFYDFGPLN